MHETMEKLRILAAVDPKEARKLVDALLDGDPKDMDRLLLGLTAPDQGRLRQLVANAVRRRSDRERIVPHLLRWLEHESDEFARTAINAALAGVDVTQRQDERQPDPLGLVQTYRYVASRLCHRVRNALPGPMMHLRGIEDLAKSMPDGSGSEMLAKMGQLRDALRIISRLVEFDTGDKYFEWRPVYLAEWLQGAGKEYNARNDQISLTVEQREGPRAIIRANDYLLETIFWNLWRNAYQAVKGACRVMVVIEVQANRVVLLISDNGSGMPDELVGSMFEESVSTHGNGKGYGLLEIRDAVQRLAGQVRVVKVESSGYRIQVTFPVEGA